MALSQAVSPAGLASEGPSSGRVSAGGIQSVATATFTDASAWVGAGVRAEADDASTPTAREPSCDKEQAPATKATPSIRLGLQRRRRSWMTARNQGIAEAADDPADCRRPSH